MRLRAVRTIACVLVADRPIPRLVMAVSRQATLCRVDEIPSCLMRSVLMVNVMAATVDKVVCGSNMRRLW